MRVPSTVRTAAARTAAARTASARTPGLRWAPRLQAVRAVDREAGMTTAEYAVGTVAACGFGGVLYKVVTSPEILQLVTGVISKAFKFSF